VADGLSGFGRQPFTVIANPNADPVRAQLVVVKDGDTETKLNPFDDAPVHDPVIRRRKTKGP
jgi:hypothetical protein